MLVDNVDLKQKVCFTDLSLSDQVSLLSSFMLITETESGECHSFFLSSHVFYVCTINSSGGRGRNWSSEWIVWGPVDVNNIEHWMWMYCIVVDVGKVWLVMNLFGISVHAPPYSYSCADTHSYPLPLLSPLFLIACLSTVLQQGRHSAA